MSILKMNKKSKHYKIHQKKRLNNGQLKNGTFYHHNTFYIKIKDFINGNKSFWIGLIIRLKNKRFRNRDLLKRHWQN